MARGESSVCGSCAALWYCDKKSRDIWGLSVSGKLGKKIAKDNWYQGIIALHNWRFPGLSLGKKAELVILEIGKFFNINFE